VTAGWAARRAQSTQVCTPAQLVVAARADARTAARRTFCLNFHYFPWLPVTGAAWY
jgi:hypothetical protein